MFIKDEKLEKRHIILSKRKNVLEKVRNMSPYGIAVVKLMFKDFFPRLFFFFNLAKYRYINEEIDPVASLAKSAAFRRFFDNFHIYDKATPSPMRRMRRNVTTKRS